MNQLNFTLLPLRNFFAKHHAVVFISVTVVLLTVVVYVLYNILTAATSDTTTTQASSLGGFDKATIDKIKNLHDSNDSSDNLTFPSPRPNPFTE